MKSQQKWICNIADFSSPKPKDSIRILCFSDTHKHHNEIPKEYLPEADIVLFGGDFTDLGSYTDTLSFKTFLKSLPCKHKVIIAGNHELTYDIDHRDTVLSYYLQWERKDYSNVFDIYRKIDSNCQKKQSGKKYNDDILNFIKKQITEDNEIIYLEDSTVNIEGLNIFGSPYSLRWHEWAFPTPRANDPDRGISESRWSKIPDDTDIVLVHGPPYNIFDKMVDNEHEGCPFLAERIKQISPSLCVFGHIHEDYGVKKIDNTIYANVSLCNYNNELENKPLLLDFVPNNKH